MVEIKSHVSTFPGCVYVKVPRPSAIYIYGSNLRVIKKLTSLFGIPPQIQGVYDQKMWVYLDNPYFDDTMKKYYGEDYEKTR